MNYWKHCSSCAYGCARPNSSDVSLFQRILQRRRTLRNHLFGFDFVNIYYSYLYARREFILALSFFVIALFGSFGGPYYAHLYF